MKATFRKYQGALYPFGQEGRDLLDSVGNDPVMIEIKRARNPKNHARYFAFIHDTFDMQDTYENKEIWRKVLQMRAGHYDEVITEKGKALYFPRSINWESLDEDQFKKLFNEIIQAFISVYGSKITPEQLEAIALGY